MNKKILIVDNSSWNIFNFRLALVKKLTQQGYDVVVVSPIDEFIHYLNEVYYIRHIPSKYLMPRSKNPFRDLLLLLELFLIYRRERPDLVIHFTIKPNIFGSLAARIAKIASIAVVTGLGYTFLHPKGINRIIPALYKLALSGVKRLIVYNPDDRAVFLKNNIIAPHKCLIVPGSGVNTNHFRPLVKSSNNGFVFLFIGRLLYDKGIKEFVEAARSLKDHYPSAEFWVAGDLNDANPAGIPKEKLLEWMEEKTIHYLGRVLDVRTVIQEASTVVLPSYREGVPRVMLEAISMGKPIITTNTAGCRETVEHNSNGFLVPAKNTKALSLAMGAMMDAPNSTLAKMGVASRKKALEQFDERIITSLYMDILKEIFQDEIASSSPSTTVKTVDT